MDEELRATLVRTLKELAKPKSTEKSRAAAFLNSPFTITLLGGVLLAILSSGLTYCMAENTKARELSVERLRQKQTFVNTFSTQLERYFELTLSVRKREIFLALWQSESDRDKVKYPDGRNFDETRIQWEKDKAYWLSQATPSPTGLIANANMYFRGSETQKSLSRLNALIDAYGRAIEYPDLTKAYNESLEEMEKAIKCMAQESYEN